MTNAEALAFIEKAKKLLCEKPDVGVSSQDKALLTKDQQFIIPNLAE